MNSVLKMMNHSFKTVGDKDGGDRVGYWKMMISS